MEAAITSAAQLICDLIVPQLAEKINSIWNNEELIKELADTVDLIRDVLDDVEGKRFQQESMNTRYKRLRNVFLDAEDILDGVQTHKEKKDLEARMLKEEKEEINKAKSKFKRSVGSLVNKLKSLIIKAQHFLSKENQVKYALEVNGTIIEVKKKLNAIAEDMQKFGLKVPSSSLAPTQMAARASGPYVNPTNIFGRDDEKRKIIDLLLRSSVAQPKVPVVSIVAPGGMGKTTVAQLVYNDKSWQESFQFKHKLWVSYSKRLDLKSLLKHVLKSICSNETGLDNLEEDHLKPRIAEIIQGERFLLVLDDVVNENYYIWDNLKRLLDCGSKESRILVTTRSRQVAKVVGSSKSTYELTGLSKEDSSQLFENFAFGETRDESLVEIGDLIVEKCCGVPLAIKVVGSLLRDASKRKWAYFRDNSLTEKIDRENQIMGILRLSYDDLDPTLKQCFSFCALFPKNDIISRETLSDIWMANVRFRTGKGETVEDACDKSLRILYNRCFLELAETMKRNHDDTHLLMQDEWDGVEEFKLHDLMHDLVKEVVGAEIFLLDSDELHIEEDVRHVMLDYGMSTFEPKGRRVRSFLDRWNYCRALNFDRFVLDCPVLRYLDVSGGMIENLTDSIGKLVHLRYLGLSNCGFQTLPHPITKLINLRKLVLTSCKNLTHLPSGMGALTCLEVLDLSYCMNLKELPRGIEKLKNLKKLLLRGTFIWRMPSGMGALLGVCEPAKFIVGSYLELKKLNHTAQLEELGPLSDLPAELVITLYGSKTSLKVGGETFTLLLNKKSLRILKIEWLSWLAMSVAGGEEEGRNQMEVLGKLQPPTSLEELTLEGYVGMTFPDWMPRDGFASVLPNLESLRLYYCDGFRYLPPLSRLDRLRALRLHGLRSLEYIVEEEENGLEATSCQLPRLESLELWDLPEFKGWHGGKDTKDSVVVPSLSSIQFRKCPNVRVPICRSLLKAFDLSSSSFDYLFAQVCKNHGTFSLSKGKEDSLRLEVNSCKVTERALSSSYMEREEAFRGVSQRLTHLQFGHCSGFKTLPRLHYLTALRELKIECCPDFTWEEDDMQTTPHHMDFTPSAHHLSWKRLTSLHQLDLWELPKLLTLPQGLQYVTSLHRINIKGCENLRVPNWAHQTYNISPRGPHVIFEKK